MDRQRKKELKELKTKIKQINKLRLELAGLQAKLDMLGKWTTWNDYSKWKRAKLAQKIAIKKELLMILMEETNERGCEKKIPRISKS